MFTLAFFKSFYCRQIDVFHELLSIIKKIHFVHYSSVSVRNGSLLFQFPLLFSIKLDIEVLDNILAKCFMPDVSLLFCFMFLYFLF